MSLFRRLLVAAALSLSFGGIALAGQTQSGGPIAVFGAGPSIFTGGAVPEDPRSPQISTTYGGLTGIFFPTPMVTVDAAPSALAVNNLATTQSGTAATPLVLTAGTGVTLSGGNYFIDGVISYGNTTGQWASPVGGATADITKTLSRAIRVVSAGNDTGITFAIVGLDIYGNQIHQTLTGASGTATTTKTFKAITSITPAGNTASTVTVGTTDVYGLPLRADAFGEIMVSWNSIIADAGTGFVAAVTTAASGTTGDVRGTYNLQTTASDGTRNLVIWQLPKSFTSATALFGVPQF